MVSILYMGYRGPRGGRKDGEWRGQSSNVHTLYPHLPCTGGPGMLNVVLDSLQVDTRNIGEGSGPVISVVNYKSSVTASRESDTYKHIQSTPSM